VIYRLAQIIYDFLDEKIVLLTDEQQPTDDSNMTCEPKVTDHIKYSQRLSIPQLSPEGRIFFFDINNK